MSILVARSQMGMTLAFQIVLAAAGVAMSLMITISEYLWLRTGDSVYLVLTKRWAKGSRRSDRNAVFARGFCIFFVEAIFLGIYLYGWSRISPRAIH